MKTLTLEKFKEVVESFMAYVKWNLAEVTEKEVDGHAIVIFSDEHVGEIIAKLDSDNNVVKVRLTTNELLLSKRKPQKVKSFEKKCVKSDYIPNHDLYEDGDVRLYISKDIDATLWSLNMFLLSDVYRRMEQFAIQFDWNGKVSGSDIKL